METVEDREGVCVGVAGDILVFHHYAPLTLPTVAVVRESFARLAATRPRSANLVVVDAALPTPAGDVRDGLVGAVKAQQEQVVGLGLVVQGQGFGAASFRAALAGMMLIARSRHPIKVFASVSEGARWVAGVLGLSPDNAAASIREIESFVRRS